MPKATAIDLHDDGTPVVRHEAPPGPAAERLRREATTLVLARGPGVIELVDSGDDEHGGAWLTTRYVGGGTLPDLARTGGQEVAIRALGQVADTLADLHERGIVHGRLAGDHVVGGARALLCGFAGARVAAVDDAIDPAVDTTAFAALVGSTCSADDGPARLARAAVAGLAAVPPTTDLRAAAEGLRAAVRASAPGAEDAPSPPARGRVLLPRTPSPTVRRGRSTRRGDPRAEGSAPAGPDAVPAPPAADRWVRRGDPRAEGSAPARREARYPRPAGGRRGRRAARMSAGSACALLVAFAVGSLAGRMRTGDGDAAAPPTTTRDVAVDGDGQGTDEGAVASEGSPPPTTTVDGTPPGPSSAPVAPGTQPSEQPPILPPPAADPIPSAPAPAREATVVSHEGARYRIGDPGDLVVVGDWDCDGSPTPTVVRPTDGSVWTFPSWAPAGAPVGAAPVGVAPSPASAAVTTGPDGCDQLTVTTEDGRAVVVAVTG